MDGRKGKPVTHADALLGAVVPGQASVAHNGGGGGRQKTNPPNEAGENAQEDPAKTKKKAKRKKQRVKKAATPRKAKHIIKQNKNRQNKLKKGEKGGGKGGDPSKAAQFKKQSCSAWGRRKDGPCCKQAVHDKECPNGRQHICEHCGSPDHFSVECPTKKGPKKQG